ncbi:hypothetical protein [Alkaliphilus sp. B6464]|uniref:hypothetical protein n=1 Tax=Alkaliphilus sp. B6464 TaxID=2731219 RepID=UPI001BA43D22|nr:hypothetical protein [Alkaliphilus sp. B6464]QUH21939.1 hypothetical protein HYG84_18705 [Alkaliphilus sp. B6464]
MKENKIKVVEDARELNLPQDEVIDSIDRSVIIKEIMTNKKFKFLPGKSNIIKNLNKMSDDQLKALVGEALIKATNQK